MAYNFVPLSVSVAGSAGSANLVASSAGQSITVWQLILSGNTTDTCTITWTAAGTATTAKIFITAANGTVTLPYTGCAWAAADVATAVTFNCAATSQVSCFYSKGIGG